MPPKNPRCTDCPPDSKRPRPAPYPGPRCASHHREAGGETPRRCKDCPPDSVRKTPHPGPRCYTHHHEEKKRRKGVAHERRVGSIYGLAPGDYDKLFRFQGGRCAICQRGKGITKRLAVDHDHRCCSGPTSCGKCVRGLLCGPCNSLLAHARDELDYFIRAHAYLISPPARRLKSGDR